MRLGLLCLFAIAPVGAAIAQSDLATRVANDPSAPQVSGAKAKLVDDPAAQGGKALRVTVTKKGQNNWDSVVESPIGKPIVAGDRLILMFDAKLDQDRADAPSSTSLYSAVQMKAAPYTSVISGQATLTPEWKPQKIEGRADKNFAGGELKVSIQLGNAKQTVDFGPIVLLNMGQ
jgi:hypothetical protein